MSFLKRKTTWSTGELWIFKWGVFSIGILIGGYFWSYLEPYKTLICFLSAICCLLAVYFWAIKTRDSI